MTKGVPPLKMRSPENASLRSGYGDDTSSAMIAGHLDLRSLNIVGPGFDDRNSLLVEKPIFARCCANQRPYGSVSICDVDSLGKSLANLPNEA